MTSDQRPVPLSALEHHAYCPRQAALIHVDGLWADNEHTVRGTVGHQRADYGSDRRERGRKVLRAVPVWSATYGLTGRCDIVEVYDDAAVVPVEYKIGTRHGQAADIQLCGQAFCLEEMLAIPIDYGFVWYSAHRSRERVDFDVDLRQATLATIAQLRRSMATAELPTAPADERCTNCQLVSTCLPEVVAAPDRLKDYLAERFRCES